jgi:hypothetical protein
MRDKTLRLYEEPVVNKPSLVIGFDGWMDGGDVSTGTIDYLRIKLGAEAFGEIEPDGFYVLNVPGPMELSSVFRPHVRYEDGVIKQYDYPDKPILCSGGLSPDAVFREGTESGLGSLCGSDFFNLPAV